MESRGARPRNRPEGGEVMAKGKVGRAVWLLGKYGALSHLLSLKICPWSQFRHSRESVQHGWGDKLRTCWLRSNELTALFFNFCLLSDRATVTPVIPHYSSKCQGRPGVSCNFQVPLIHRSVVLNLRSFKNCNPQMGGVHHNGIVFNTPC